MQALVRCEGGTDNVTVLSFLGIVNDARHAGQGVDKKSKKGWRRSDEYKSQLMPGQNPQGQTTIDRNSSPNLPPPPPGSPSSRPSTRNVIHISQLRGLIKWGDLILFQCANSVSSTQRLATGAEWDHVALVVKRRYSRTLELLESTGEGKGRLVGWERVG